MPDDGRDLVALLSRYLATTAGTSRRSFIKAGLGSTATLAGVAAWARGVGTAPFVIVENAEGLIVSDTTRCVGCKRCELACTEINDGRAQPSLARIKVSRNYNFGPKGQQLGFGRSQGEFGNFRIIQDTCKECPHPVPCATACPNGAIVTSPKTKGRMVDVARCTGCRLCQRACPWEMMAFDEETERATKCFLCNGAPECVEACPAMALQYVSWRDLTRAVPTRQAVLPALTPAAIAACGNCHTITKKR
jgi:Fe-S-cluster-containing dehydrogenase component